MNIAISELLVIGAVCTLFAILAVAGIVVLIIALGKRGKQGRLVNASQTRAQNERFGRPWMAIWILAACLLGACTPESSSPTAEPAGTSESPQTDLEVVLQVPATLPDGDSVELEFTLINNSETGLHVLKWYTPLEGIAGEIFRVERDGQPVPYEGLLAMRGNPLPDDYVFLSAGASVSRTVDLAAVGESGAPVYDFSMPGDYTINFISPRISHVAQTEDQIPAVVDDLGPVDMPSNEVTVRIGGSSEQGDEGTRVVQLVHLGRGGLVRHTGHRDQSREIVCGDLDAWEHCHRRQLGKDHGAGRRLAQVRTQSAAGG